MSFTVTAEPGTDVWRKPPSIDVFNAPTHNHSKGPMSTLLSGNLSFTAPYNTQYDQVGLLFTIAKPSAAKPQWIKAGIEFYNDLPRLSVVCCESWADWSVADVGPDAAPKIQAGKQGVTIAFEKVVSKNSGGVSLWIYYVDGETRTPLREVGWFFAEDGEVDVSAFAARDKKGTEPLVASFWGFDVKWEQE
ncbi:hypothetical protein S40285_02367 [Stachybotrys chlorohalonatus IBT 40285]|uniref:Beta-xylosidase C-terminal Concanavalin A-like domain-containing protein n=1 Tax=Stachybotrys chlorohalonatus (strain IBT 40285) TaxID=1283841 RepID=A0A084QPP4_STAC4|nr:hypothetical protein S40285_02367 [Stachybotrys chlorohalonata IBT 40285]